MRGFRVAAASGLLLLAGIMPLAGPAVAVAGDTGLYVGNAPAVTPADATFVSSPALYGTPGTYPAAVRVTFPNAYWEQVSAAGPNGAELTAGTTYSDTTILIDATHPALDVPGCASVGTGSFTVHEVTYAADGSFAVLALDWTVDCYGLPYHGALRFNSTWPVKAWTTSNEAVDLGDVSIGSSSSTTYTLRSDGSAPVTISTVALDTTADAFSIVNDGCTGTVVAAGNTCTFDVSVTPTTPGSITATPIVTTDGIEPTARIGGVTAHGQIPTTVSVSPDPAYPSSVDYITLFVHVTGGAAGWADVRVDGMQRAQVGFAAGDTTSSADIGVLPVGTYALSVTFHPTDADYAISTGTGTLTIGSATTTALTASRTTTYVGQTTTLTATANGPTNLTGGTLTIRDDTAGVDLATLAVTATHRSISVSPSLALGSHLILASYSGTADFGQSAISKTITVLADTGVALLSTTVAPTTFYPYADGYLDTTVVSGRLNEAATVSISIYNSGGTRVFAKALGTKTTTYSYRWNGRSTAGAALASGKYRIVESFHDTTGHVLTKTLYVYLSTKRLYTSTTYLNLSASQYAKKTTAWIGWQFTMPSATIYKSIVFQLYGKSVAVPGIEIGGWDIRRCFFAASWSPSCVGSWSGVGFTTNWYSKTLSATYSRSGRTVRTFAETTYGSGLVSKVRLKVVYGVLR
jgi:hypothetical protein